MARVAHRRARAATKPGADISLVSYITRVTKSRDPGLPRPRADHGLFAPAAVRGLRRVVLDGHAEPDLPGAPRPRARGAGHRLGRAGRRQAGPEGLRADRRRTRRAVAVARRAG